MSGTSAQDASAVDVAAFIDAQPVGAFQVKLLLTCATVLFLDGFDTTAIGYVAPALAKEWHIGKEALGPQRRPARRLPLVIRIVGPLHGEPARHAPRCRQSAHSPARPAARPGGWPAPAR